MAKTNYRDKQSEVRINERYAKVVDLLNKGWTEYKIAKEVGVSQPQICRDLQVVVAQWKESYLAKIDIVKAKEIARLEHLMAAHWEEFEISKWRDIPEVPAKKDFHGRIVTKAIPATRKRVVGSVEILAQILEVWKQIAKIYGIAQDINLSATQNNLSIGGSKTDPNNPATQFPWEILFGKPIEQIPSSSTLSAPVDPIEAEIARVLEGAPERLEEVERNGEVE